MLLVSSITGIRCCDSANNHKGCGLRIAICYKQLAVVGGDIIKLANSKLHNISHDRLTLFCTAAAA